MEPNLRPAPLREEALFQAALQLEPGPVRAAFLDQACAGDPALRRRLDALLAAHAQPDGVLPTEAEASLPTVQVRPADEPPREVVGQTIGRYKLLEKVGEGGCGVVYVAEQTEPIRRRVALKVIKLGMDTRAVVARFEAERQALAMMDHPNIAKVLDAGATETGRPYFVMELVRGVKITEYCDQNHLATRERLDLFVKVCQAIQHAHQKGIIHRDIKPSNILVTLHDGVPVPKVIDFGIAKATEGRLTEATVYTQLHQMIGTPAYMSPEQAEMSGLDVDTRSDIYGLGVLLYELLTGKTPFDARELVSQGLEAMRRTIREQEPVRPSTRLAALSGQELTTTAQRRSLDALKLISLLQRDLDWIVMKCLEKDRTRRYETASGLAADIQRHLGHEPVVARPPSTAYRLEKFVRRNKLMVTAAGLVSAALVLGIAGSAWQAWRASVAEAEAQAERKEAQAERQAALKARDRETAQRQRAEAGEAAARRALYAADVNLAHQAWTESNLGRLRRLLANSRPERGGEDPRGWWEWRYLWGLARGHDLREIARFDGQVWRITCADQGGWVTVGLVGTGAEERGGFLYRLGGDRLSNRRVFATNTSAVAVFLPRLGRLLSNRLDDRGRPGISVLNASTLEETTRLPTTNEVTALRVSRDGKWVASLERVLRKSVALTVWKTEDWSRCWTTSVIGDGLMSGGRAEFLADDRRLAVGNEWGEVTVFQTATGESMRAFTVLPGPRGINDVLSLAYVPDAGLLVVAAGYDDAHELALWNPDTGERVRELSGHQAWVADLAVSSDGRWLASASADQTVRLWNTQTWEALDPLRGHEDEVYCLAFSADGQRLISGDKQGSVRLWSVPPPKRPPTPQIVSEQYGILLLSPDSKRILTHWPGGGYAIRDMDTGQELAPVTGVGGCEGFWQFSPDGQHLLIGGPTGKVKVWDFGRNAFLEEFDTGREDETHPLLCVLGTDLVLMHHLVGDTSESSVQRRWLSPDTKRYYTLWHYDQRRLVTEFPHEGAWLQSVNLSSRGDLAVMHGDGSFSLRRITPLSAPTTFWPHRRGITDVAFTPDGSLFATAGSDGVAKLWDAATRREIVALKGHLLSTIRALAITPDGRRLATVGGGKEGVRLWDVQTHQELFNLTLGTECPGLTAIAFSRDGNKLIGQSAQGLHIWRAPSWEEIAAAEAKGKMNDQQP